MAARKNRLPAAIDPAHRAFIQAFGDRAWDHALAHEIGADRNPYWQGVCRYWGGFRVAFEVNFGRAANDAEVDLLALYWLERAHAHLAALGSDAVGFWYFADMPPHELVKRRAQVAKHGLEPLPAPRAVQGGEWWHEGRGRHRADGGLHADAEPVH